MTDVQKCPFCHWPALAMREGDGPWAVYCNNDGTTGSRGPVCGVSGPERPTEAEAIAAWNLRSTDDLLEALEGLIKLWNNFTENGEGWGNYEDAYHALAKGRSDDWERASTAIARHRGTV